MAISSQYRPTVVSLFSGCGGSSLGYKMAGGDVRLAVEWDDDCVATYRLNFPGTPIWHGDIVGLSAARALEMAGLAEGELDVLDGSPPCQGFSTAGKRKMADPRNRLFEEFARLLAGTRPRVFVMENVSGLVKGKMRLVFAEILRMLKGCRYDVRAQLLNTKWFGTPQSRRRVIFVGVRDGIGYEPRSMMPEPTRMQTVGEALARLPRQVLAPEYHSRQVIDAWHRARPGQSLRKAVRYVGSFQSVRLDAKKPSHTQVRVHRHWHPTEPRQLTDIECGVLMGFPPGFQWLGTKGQRTSQIGNSVPPPFMQAIATAIFKML